jgi:hypothetical protein
MSVRPTASSDRTLYTHRKCMSVRLTAGMLRARERVWRSLRTPQQSLWMGGLGDFLHMVAGAILCGTPLLCGRLVGLAVAKFRAFLRTSDRTALTLALDLLEGRRVGCSDEPQRDGTLDRELRLAERVQLLVHALAQDSRRLLVQAVVDART